MKNSCLENVAVTARLIILMIIIFCLCIAKSLYLNLFITTFVLIICLISKIKFIEYLKFIKTMSVIFLIVLAIDMLVYGGINFSRIVTVIYKGLFISLALKVFCNACDFEKLNSAIYRILNIIKFVDFKQISLDFTYFICFLSTFIDSKDSIKLISDQRNVKNYFTARLLYSINYIENLKTRNRLNFYRSKLDFIDSKSAISIALSIIFLVLCIFKEVMV